MNGLRKLASVHVPAVMVKGILGKTSLMEYSILFAALKVSHVEQSADRIIYCSTRDIFRAANMIEYSIREVLPDIPLTITAYAKRDKLTEKQRTRRPPSYIMLLLGDGDFCSAFDSSIN
nr:hypothetical protein [Tanacetum cinerariifolium]